MKLRWNWKQKTKITEFRTNHTGFIENKRYGFLLFSNSSAAPIQYLRRKKVLKMKLLGNWRRTKNTILIFRMEVETNIVIGGDKYCFAQDEVLVELENKNWVLRLSCNNDH